jgi:hypothetical protein
MVQALGHVLPIAVTLALSSVPITVVILILLSPNRRRSSIPFLVGWVLGIAGFTILFTLLARVLPRPSSNRTALGVGAALMVVGAALLVFGVVSWRRSIGKPPRGSLPRWLRAVGSLRPLPAFGLAAGLSVRPKAILLGIAAGVSLDADAAGFAATAIVIAIYTVIAATTVARPVVAARVSPARMEPRLAAIRGWLSRNNRTVSIIITLIMGVVIFSSGLARL